MATIKMCDRDGQMFADKSSNSMRIEIAVIYRSDGTPVPFSGDLCPDCGKEMINKTKGVRMLVNGDTEPADETDPTGVQSPGFP